MKRLLLASVFLFGSFSVSHATPAAGWIFAYAIPALGYTLMSAEAISDGRFKVLPQSADASDPVIVPQETAEADAIHGAKKRMTDNRSLGLNQWSAQEIMDVNDEG